VGAYELHSTAPAPTMRWTLLTDPVGHPGWRQMAIDQALLDRAERTGEGAVRLYRWEPWCLSFGRNEPALLRYDRAAITRLGLATVRRPTGGRAVWHARELTYAVAAPSAWFGSLAETYRIIHATFAAALRNLGVDATLADAGPAIVLGAGACFAASAGGEVISGGRKLLGSAQLRQGSAFLQHGSLLLEDNQRLVAAITLGQAPPSDEITLLEAAGRIISFEEVAGAITDQLGDWAGEWQDGHPQLDVSALAAGTETRFRDDTWTWRR
jgi:lipoate-protein ligase A